MIRVLILTCLAGIPAERCTPDTALDVREARAAMPMQCAMAGLTAAASDPRGSAGLMIKITCQRVRGATYGGE